MNPKAQTDQNEVSKTSPGRLAIDDVKNAAIDTIDAIASLPSAAATEVINAINSRDAVMKNGLYTYERHPVSTFLQRIKKLNSKTDRNR